MIMKNVFAAFMIIGFAAMAGCASVEPSPGLDTQPVTAPPPPPPLETQPIGAPPPPPPTGGN